MASPDPTDAIASSLSGEHLASLLRSSGPIVSCVLLQAKPSATSITENQSDSNGHCDDALGKNTDTKESSDEAKMANRDLLTHLITEIQIDTTPKKSMVSEILGGKFTFLGQYEDEGIVVMIRREQERSLDLTENPHKLQPPFHNVTVYGDILLMRVADEQDGCNSDSNGKGLSHCDPKELESTDKEQSVNRAVDDEASNEDTNAMSLTNEEFFLNYTKDEYISFASRTDILPEESDEDNETPGDEQVDSDESESDDQIEKEGKDGDEDGDEDYSIDSDEDADSDEEEDAIGMMNLLLGQILKRFQEENGRGPDTHELLSIRAALAQRLGIDSIPPVEDTDFSNSLQNGGDDGEEKVEPSNRKVNNDDNNEERTCSTEKRKASSGEKDDGLRKKVKFSNENQVKIIEGLNDSIDEEEEENNASTCD